MLLDQFLPTHHFNEVHHLSMRASPAQVMHAVRHVTTSELSAIVRALFALRSWPERLFGNKGFALDSERPLLEAMIEQRFLVLGEEPDRELVFGTLLPATIGRFWQRQEEPPRLQSAEEFLRHADPAQIKTAANFLIEEIAPDTCEVSTETRVCAHAEEARRKFAAYWRVIAPGSAIIRRLWLQAIRRRAEQRDGIINAG